MCIRDRVVRGLFGLSLSQEEEEKEETEEEAVASDSDKSVDGEDTATGEWITTSTVHSEFKVHVPAHIHLLNKVRGVFIWNTVCSHICTWTDLQLYTRVADLV